MSSLNPVRHPGEARLFARLDQLFMDYETVEHAAVFTVEDSQSIKSDLPGGHTKNLFLKDKAGQFVLVSALADTSIRLNTLHKHIGTKRLSFAKAEDLERLLDVRPGSVTVLSVINDVDCQVRLILDRALLDHEYVWFHPLRNTASTRIRSDQLIQFAFETGHNPLIIDFVQIAERPTE